MTVFLVRKTCVKESGLVLIGDVYIAEHTSTKRHVCSAVREREGVGRERERGTAAVVARLCSWEVDRPLQQPHYLFY